MDLIGIPYFGLETPAIIQNIFSSKCERGYKMYKTVKELIDTEAIANDVVVIIDGKWLTWLRDIQFNYRDGSCTIPYYKFNTRTYKYSKKRSNNKGHLITNKEKGTVTVRYKYDLLEKQFGPNESLTVYNLKTEKKYHIKAKNWFDTEFNMLNLYIDYIRSAYRADAPELGYPGGYHYIARQFKGFVNMEKKLRDSRGLKHYNGRRKDLVDYRDVREYNFEQLFTNAEDAPRLLYRIRKLMFDSHLYCIIQQNAVPDKEYQRAQYSKLGSQPCLVKYAVPGCTPTLIFKSYWYGQGTYEDRLKIFNMLKIKEEQPTN